VLPIQSLHLHRISPELGSGLACWKTSEAFPDFEQIDCVVSGRNPQFTLGILCSILLSYVDTELLFNLTMPADQPRSSSRSISFSAFCALSGGQFARRCSASFTQ
jgi:hypothetical protein